MSPKATLLLAMLLMGCANVPKTDLYGTPYAAFVPEDVRAFVLDVQICDHFAGEEPYDAERRRQIEAAIGEACPRLDKRYGKLKDQYRESEAITKFLDDNATYNGIASGDRITMFNTITDQFLAAPQISVADIAAAKAAGVTMVINNRPDGEAPSDPQGAEIEAAARAAGLDYVAIPITHSGFSANQVDAMIAALGSAKGKVLGYCRSGTRSTLLWSLAQAKLGVAPDKIAAEAAAGGYDISPIRAMVDALAAGKD
ncbi:MAG: TIGR01244 family sulfur transferase [Parasphingorhabdus sp.]|nr:TIGR01244 family sulfur transferase [Parasphingorhabdus sp.]